MSNKSRLAHIDNQNELRARERAAEKALALEAAREEHIRERERDHERERIITPLLPTEPQHEFQTPIRCRATGAPITRMDLPGERGEEFGGVVY